MLSAIAVPAKIRVAKVAAAAVDLAMCLMFLFSGVVGFGVFALPLVISIGESSQYACEILPGFLGNIHRIETHVLAGDRRTLRTEQRPAVLFVWGKTPNRRGRGVRRCLGDCACVCGGRIATAYDDGLVPVFL